MLSTLRPKGFKLTEEHKKHVGEGMRRYYEKVQKAFAIMEAQEGKTA